MKTLKLIDKYIRLLEQDAQQPVEIDATDLESQPAKPEVAPFTPEGEKSLVALLVQAFAHTPTSRELSTVDAINQELGQTNPKEVAETINTLLNSSSTGDQAMIDRIDKE